MWDRTGENQVYSRQQKTAEEQLRFDKTEKPSRLASEDSGGSLALCPPHRCNLVGILLLDKTANVSTATSSAATNVKLTTSAVIVVNRQLHSGPRGVWSGFCPITGNSELTLCPLMTPGGLRDTHRDTQ